MVTELRFHALAMQHLEILKWVVNGHLLP